MRWCPSKRRSSGTPQLRQPSRPAHVGPDGRRPRGGAGALQHHGPNEPGHRRRAAALRDGGPAGRRNRGGPRGLYTSAQTDAAIAAAIAPCILHLGRNGCRHRGGAAEQRPDLERRADVQPAAGQQRAAEPVGGRRPDRQLPEPGRHDPHRIGPATPAARPTRKRKRAQRSPPPSTPWTCPNSRTRRRSRPSSPRPCRPTWRASWPTTPPAAR